MHALSINLDELQYSDSHGDGCDGESRMNIVRYMSRSQRNTVRMRPYCKVVFIHFRVVFYCRYSQLKGGFYLKKAIAALRGGQDLRCKSLVPDQPCGVKNCHPLRWRATAAGGCRFTMWFFGSTRLDSQGVRLGVRGHVRNDTFSLMASHGGIG